MKSQAGWDYSMELRDWYEFAYSCGRTFQSKETHFIHYHPHHKKDPKSIPVYENLLFILALFRMKTMDNIQEAKTLLKKLFYFQKKTFPVYLHEYPVCYDRTLASRLLPPLYWIQKEFHKVLGDDLEHELQQSIQELTPFVEEIKPQPYQLDALSNQLIYLQMHPETEQHKSLLSSLQSIWHDALHVYAGPAFELQFMGSEVKPSYLQYFEQYVNGKAPPKDHSIYGLQAALLQHIEVPKKQIPFEKRTSQAYIYHDQQFAIAVYPESKHYPLYMVVGGRSIVLDLPHAKLQKYSWDRAQRVLELIIEIDPASSQHKEKETSLSFYISRNDKSSIFVEGKKATAFTIEQKISLKVGDHLIACSFSKQSGDSQFFGHILQGNRPTQLIDDNFYDHEVCLRTVHGVEKTCVRCTLSFASSSS